MQLPSIALQLCNSSWPCKLGCAGVLEEGWVSLHKMRASGMHKLHRKWLHCLQRRPESRATPVVVEPCRGLRCHTCRWFAAIQLWAGRHAPAHCRKVRRPLSQHSRHTCSSRGLHHPTTAVVGGAQSSRLNCKGVEQDWRRRRRWVQGQQRRSSRAGAKQGRGPWHWRAQAAACAEAAARG